MSGDFSRYNLGLFNSGTYSPIACPISDVTQEQYPIVTTTIDHSFVVGNRVQFSIPQAWGMYQLDGLKAYVITVPSSNEIVVNVDTSTFNVFVTPTPPNIYVVIEPAQVAGIGDINTGTSSSGGIPANPNTIPGAYQNQPP